MKKKKKEIKVEHGGHRKNSGRKKNSAEHKAIWGRVTVMLKRDTIRALRKGADSRFVGEYLQAHLELHPPPSQEWYEAYKKDPERFQAKTTTEPPAPEPAEVKPERLPTVRQALLQVKRNMRKRGEYQPVL